MAKTRIARKYRMRRRGGARPQRDKNYYSIARPLRGAMKKLYYYKQTVFNPSSIGPFSQVGGAGEYLKAMSFNLGQVGGNLGPFTALYDSYSIRKIVVKIIPKFNSGDIDVPAASGGELPNIAHCLDYDDSNTPANFGDVMQRQNAKLTRGNKIIKRVFKPSVNVITDGTSTAAGFMQRYAPWLDITNVAVPHYGLKLAIQPMPTGVNANYDVAVTYYLAFKQVR